MGVPESCRGPVHFGAGAQCADPRNADHSSPRDGHDHRDQFHNLTGIGVLCPVSKVLRGTRTTPFDDQQRVLSLPYLFICVPHISCSQRDGKRIMAQSGILHNVSCAPAFDSTVSDWIFDLRRWADRGRFDVRDTSPEMSTLLFYGPKGSRNRSFGVRRALLWVCLVLEMTENRLPRALERPGGPNRVA